jgi:hypothetical protein
VVFWPPPGEYRDSSEPHMSHKYAIHITSNLLLANNPSFNSFASDTTELTVNIYNLRPTLWSSSQSSWLQIRRPGFDSRHYQETKAGLERGALSLVSTTEELLDRKVAAPV